MQDADYADTLGQRAVKHCVFFEYKGMKARADIIAGAAHAGLLG